jgi:hypothetical protein
MTPKRVLGMRASHKHKNTKMKVAAKKIGGRNSVGITARGISTFPNVFIIITMTKRE